MFRRTKKARNGSQKANPAEPASTSEEVKNYYDLDRDERRELLRALLEGMSPNPEVRTAANEAKQGFTDRYGKSDDD